MRAPVVKSCGKHWFEDEIAAKLALADIWHRDSPTRPRLEKRAYRCPTCDGWHLTSQGDRSYTQVKERN